MKKRLLHTGFASFLLCVLIGLSSNVFSQYRNVKIDDEENPCEPTIFINPKAPNIMVAGAMMDKAYYSDDFGKSWKIRSVSSRYGVFGDPCIIADNEGTFYYLHLADPEDRGWQSEKVLERIVCQKSNNGKRWGRSRSIGYNPPKQQDKEWAVFDEYTGNIYVTWTQFDEYESDSPGDSTHIMFTYSNDRGRSFVPPVRINQIGGDCKNGDNTVKGAIPATGPGGAVYVAWALNEKIYFDKSIDGGVTWLKKDKTIAAQPGGWKFSVPGIGHCNGFPMTACDLSYGPYHGNIYVNWTDQRNGEDNTDVWIVKSEDGGESWSDPMRVNDDRTDKHQFFSSMCVDQVTGNVYVLYYDRREYNDNKTDVYMAYSTDGGKTFKNVKISESPFLPQENVFFGNYNSIYSYAGYVRPIWTRMENGKTSIWTAIIDLP